MHQRKIKRHKTLPTSFRKLSAKSQHEKNRPASTEDSGAGKPATLPSPSMTTIDKTTAFRSFLRNALLDPEERAEALRRVGRDPSEELAGKKVPSVPRAWEAVQKLETHPEDVFEPHEATTSTSTALVAPAPSLQQTYLEEAALLEDANVVSTGKTHDDSKTYTRTIVVQSPTTIPYKDLLHSFAGPKTPRVSTVAEAGASGRVSAVLDMAELETKRETSGAANAVETRSKPKVSIVSPSTQAELKRRRSGGSAIRDGEQKQRGYNVATTEGREESAKLPGILVDRGSKLKSSGSQQGTASEDGRRDMGNESMEDRVPSKAEKEAVPERRERRHVKEHAGSPRKTAPQSKETEEVRKEAEPVKRARHFK